MCIATTEEDDPEELPWKLNFDRATNAVGNGIGAVLVSPRGNHHLFTIKLDFDCMNNMAEYEACIMGEWQTRDPKLIDYRKLVLELVKDIEEDEEKDDHPWYNNILQYVKNREYPDQAGENDKRTLRRLAIDYVLDEDILYKRRKDQVLLRCVDVVEAKRILEEVREEAVSYANMTKSAVSKFIKKEIICRYGMSERIISDNALNLNNNMIVEVCSQFKIKHHNSSLYHPKMNGAVEAANKNIMKIMGMMIETYKDWYEKLPFALFAYRTSLRTSTGATRFSLVYGIEAVLPIEVEIPSLRVLSKLKLDEAE
ncbi:uncharacterized protein LOC128296629 [Gossypium arboreum]|uniref:uncharacterized protein LOC128296629 n=1 Tax=Gossypium arboreum TaxID=29729 RepID=UPI0022F19B70|nr:uncharacterized protein LOC128296629 [Gossypium arboreum]